eukprot:TRINITY_DN19840_c0_g1_i1.p1 TRINITY_DN19840_c0_g1~~TRINITY_DN19840_c0_g1_i1.p1  ORF type:complete len:167 (+),score=10.51 TRINITY_DN19840_c0_g1_i1:289-789(+)
MRPAELGGSTAGSSAITSPPAEERRSGTLKATGGVIAGASAGGGIGTYTSPSHHGTEPDLNANVAFTLDVSPGPPSSRHKKRAIKRTPPVQHTASIAPSSANSSSGAGESSMCWSTSGRCQLLCGTEMWMGSSNLCPGHAASAGTGTTGGPFNNDPDSTAFLRSPQ